MVSTLTTQNHSAVALTVAVLTPDAIWPMKILILFGLAISHLPADAIPHLHFYSFAELRKGLVGAFIELGGGLFILPLTVFLITRTEWRWLALCVIAASLFDFFVAAKIGAIVRLNHVAHWWERNEKTPIRIKAYWEIAQTIALFGILAMVIYHLA